LIILGIEASCDDTSIAIVDNDRNILALQTIGQNDMHKIYGGVVPELASRLHLNAIQKTFDEALTQAKISASQIDAISATAGPGLIGGLIVGVMFAKGLAIALNKPFYPINHLEAHALTPRLTDENLQFPYLLLLASGGNTQIVLVRNVGDYEIIGKTIDDAAGECFDKVAKVLELPYPNGVEIQNCAKNYDSKICGEQIHFNKPQIAGADFSFSGLKSNIIRFVQKITTEQSKDGKISDEMKANICWSFNKTICEIFENKMQIALQMESVKNAKITAIVAAGGVAANTMVRELLQTISINAGIPFIAPPLSLCGDNGAMIAWTAIEHINRNIQPDINFSPRPRWFLSDIKL
jgi:N6-L-threonylcarbamoyladenine synthase